jgi:hypothetical protein
MVSLKATINQACNIKDNLNIISLDDQLNYV